MAQTSHLDGAALHALSMSAGRPAFVPPREPSAAEKPRDRIWELAETLHCSIVGTCLTTADGRALLGKLGFPDARTMSEHRLHGQVVHLAGRRDGGGKLLQKMLDRRHGREIRRFAKARSTDDVHALWRESLERGEIPGAYWAAITHPATDWGLVQDIFGDVHMLSHLVGQSNRADIRRLRQLEADLAARDDTIAVQEQRIRALGEERDGLSARARAVESAQAVAVAASASAEHAEKRASVHGLETRLSRERAHAEALEEKIAVLMQASGRLSVALEVETGRRLAAEAERDAAEAMLNESETGEGGRGETLRFDGRTLLYVGGRPRQVANLRRFTESRGGRLIGHDGGIEDSMSLLPGLVSQADLVIFPVECVSHDATAMVKRCCEAAGTPLQPVRSASLASFVHAVTAAQGAARGAEPEALSPRTRS